LKPIARKSLLLSRISWILPVLLLAVLTAMVAAPHRAVAQSPDAQPAHASAANSGSLASGETNLSKQTEEQQELDVFRHAPIVAKIGQKMGLDVETTARIFEFLNFAVIFLAIVIPLAIYLPRILRNRRQVLSREIEAARQATADANARLKAVEAQLAGLAGEIAKFRTQVEQESLEDEKRIKATLEEETARIVATAEQEIAAAAAQARRGLRHFAADLAIGQAEKQLVLTPETDRALISEFISEAGRNGAGKGGTN
jgi:F-type H+-transporting ATPase subunit b